MDISFIIPVHNAEDTIAKCIWSVKKITRLAGLKHEIIMVDLASTDNTVTIASNMGAKVLALPEGNMSRARNFGASKAIAPVLVFLDADVLLTDKWHENIHSELGEGIYNKIKKHKSTYIAGSTVSIPEGSPWLVKSWFGVLGYASNFNYINSSHMIINRHTFYDLLGFDETLETGDDVDFCKRARERGYFLADNTVMKVVYLGYPKTVKDFFRYQRWRGRGGFANLDMLKTKMSVVVMALYAYLIVGAMLTLAYGWTPGLIWLGITVPGLILTLAYYRTRCFHPIPLTNIIPNTYLAGVYLSARMLSAYDVVVDKVKTKYREMIENRIQGELSK